jgi:subtilase family serine protease
VTKGKYLDFNITVLNEGLVGIDSINLTIFVDGEGVQIMELGEIGIGYGRTLKASNVRLPESGAEKISFVVDSEEIVKELNEDNNAVEMVVGSQ